MLNKNFFTKISKQHRESLVMKQKVSSQADRVLHSSKQAIFAMHRGDIRGAGKHLRLARGKLASAIKISGVPKNSKGVLGAALEEYVEAHILFDFVQAKKIGSVPNIRISANIYFAALSDVVGELARIAVKSATKKDQGEVERVRICAEKIMEQLYNQDFTGYLRTKFDQAKGHFRKIEQIVYDLSLRT